ncbi:MAG: HNH endonuclease family protein [Planctomycetota bacterium]|nr:HNH endonuclease family protein [Planctomycetota bacterium]
MLAVAAKFEQVEAVKAFKLILSWCVRFLIVGGGRSGSVNEGYAKIANEIWENKITDVKALAKAVVSLIPTDSEFGVSFASATVGLPYLARYYLRSIEQKMLDEKEPEFVVNADATQITLEHVLPENPLTGTWTHFDRSDMSAYINRIGNLALLKATQNSDIGNAEFPDKVKEYKKSGFLWTQNIAEKKVWGTKEITERQTKMAECAVKTWPLK